MKVNMLVDNETSSKEYGKKHGLSIYIETSKHKVLFDLGPNGLFLENAIKLGINVEEIDIVIISHGHGDHGGGLKTFLKENKRAKIYISREAFGEYYISVLSAIKVYVGLDKNLNDNDRFVFTDGNHIIDDELMLFSVNKKAVLKSSGSEALLVKNNGKYELDTFRHEQNLIIKNDEKNILLSGCSHKGIITILNEAESLLKNGVDTVIGGFHLMNPPLNTGESPELVKAIANILDRRVNQIYTCHCTGLKSYRVIKEEIGEKVKYLSAGDSIEI